MDVGIEGSELKAFMSKKEVDPKVDYSSIKEGSSLLCVVTGHNASGNVVKLSANLQSARASAVAARTRASRYKPLAEMEAISKQDYTDALAQARQADAAVAQNNATLRVAQVNMRFTRVPAPITGRIGLSNFTEGALVTANQADALATITRLDPIYVDIKQSAAELLKLDETEMGFERPDDKASSPSVSGMRATAGMS